MPSMRNPFAPGVVPPRQRNRINPMMDNTNDMNFMDLAGGYQEPDTEDIETPYRNMYLQKLMEAPKYEDYAPSTGRRILSGLLGGLTGLHDPNAGMNIANTMLNQKFNTARQRFGQEVEPLASAAKVEQQTVKEKQDSMKDKYEYMKAKNTHMLNVLKAESAHRKRLADIQNMEDDNARADAEMAETKKYRTEMEKHRANYLAFQKEREKGRESRFTRAQEQRERLHGGEKTVSPEQQKVTKELAKDTLSRDDRFKEFWDSENKVFKVGKMDEETKQSFYVAYARAEDKIINKTKSGYTKEADLLDPNWLMGDDDGNDTENDNDEDDTEYETDDPTLRDFRPWRRR